MATGGQSPRSTVKTSHRSASSASIIRKFKRAELETQEALIEVEKSILEKSRELLQKRLELRKVELEEAENLSQYLGSDDEGVDARMRDLDVENPPNLDLGVRRTQVSGFHESMTSQAGVRFGQRSNELYAPNEGQRPGCSAIMEPQLQVDRVQR